MSNPLRARLRAWRNQLFPRKLCENVGTWSQAHGGQVTQVYPGGLITRALPHTVEPEISEAYTSRVNLKVPPRYVTRIKKARLAGADGLVILPDGSFSIESVYVRERLETLASFRHPPPRFEFQQGNYFSLLSTWSKQGNYYHWLHDSLLRLYQVMEHLPQDTRFIVPAGLNSFQRASLEMMGLDASRRVEFGANDAWQLENFYFAPPPIHSGHDRSETAAWLRERLLAVAGAVPSRRRRLYISRRNAPTRRVRNEREVEDLMASFGFETVFNETLSFREQICLYAEAEAVVANHGAGLTNIWFAPQGAQVLDMLRPDRTKHTFVYWSLANALGHDYWYFWTEPISFPDEPLRRPDDFIPIDKLERTLHAMGLVAADSPP